MPELSRISHTFMFCSIKFSIVCLILPSSSVLSLVLCNVQLATYRSFNLCIFYAYVLSPFANAHCYFGSFPPLAHILPLPHSPVNVFVPDGSISVALGDCLQTAFHGVCFPRLWEFNWKRTEKFSVRVFNVRIKGGSYTNDLPLLLLDARFLAELNVFLITQLS